VLPLVLGGALSFPVWRVSTNLRSSCHKIKIVGRRTLGTRVILYGRVRVGTRVTDICHLFRSERSDVLNVYYVKSKLEILIYCSVDIGSVGLSVQYGHSHTSSIEII
jgi:hypothetical protein